MRKGLNIAFRDFTLLMLLGFIAIVIILLPHINEPKKDKATQLENEATQPGNVSVEIRWGDGIDIDVDLWARAPGDSPVGFSSLRGKVFNLLRDDLGKAGDPLGLNYENIYSRGVPAGEYIVNVHLYNARSSRPPVDVIVVISIKKPDGRLQKVLARQVTLRSVGHEITVVRFRLDSEGSLIKSSLNTEFKKLTSVRSIASGAGP